jgi:hypothetical protein
MSGIFSVAIVELSELPVFFLLPMNRCNLNGLMLSRFFKKNDLEESDAYN